MESTTNYSLTRRLSIPYAEAVRLVKVAPKKEGFGALTEIDVGLLLPCNVVVYEDDDGSVVSAFDPRVALGLAEKPAQAEVGEEARGRRQRVLEHL